MTGDNDLDLTLEGLSTMKGISFGHWNCCSLFPKFEHIDQLLSVSNLEFLFISESWLTPLTETRLIDISGYKFFRLDRDRKVCKNRGGGVGIYCKDRSNVVKIDRLCFSLPYIEVLCCKLKLVNTRDIYLLCIYRPPDGDVRDFIDKLSEILVDLRTKSNIEILIGGILI